MKMRNKEFLEIVANEIFSMADVCGTIPNDFDHARSLLECANSGLLTIHEFLKKFIETEYDDERQKNDKVQM